jgi:shikimate kinase
VTTVKHVSAGKGINPPTSPGTNGKTELMNIYLIGYRCTGKTSVGRLLAEALGMAFEDMDDRIAAESGMSISEMVKGRGWDFFRQKEASLLKEISARDNQVVSTGGGVVLRAENRRAIRGSGVAVWLTAKPATIMRRMLGDSSSGEFRPALTDDTQAGEIQETLRQRLPLYAQLADYALATDHFPTEEVCRAVSVWLDRQNLIRARG